MGCRIAMSADRPPPAEGPDSDHGEDLAHDADTPVLAGQQGRRRRATREELLALVNEQRARHGLPAAE
jgi:hypothetical protein